MIPKKIHYIWIGKNKPESLKKTIDTWKKRAPNYSLIEWNEKKLPNFDNKFYQEALENGDYAFASDYARLKILYKYGGIYMDTDMYLLRNPTKILTNKQLVFGIQNSKILFSAGFIAAIPKQEFIGEAINFYDEVNYNDVYKRPNTELLSPIICKMYNFDHNNRTQFRKNGTVVAYNSNVLLQPSFHSIAMHIGEKSWATHNKHDDLRIKLRRHIKNQFSAGTFSILNNTFRKIL